MFNALALHVILVRTRQKIFMPTDIAPAILNQCSDILNAHVLNTRYIGGGDINVARILETNKGSFFFKMNSGKDALQIFAAESMGLKLLAKAGVIGIPKVIGLGQNGQQAFLLLEYIERAEYVPDDSWELFGRQLAALHKTTNDHFGLDHNNFIGSLPQINDPHSEWVSFFIACRLQPQVKMAYEANRLHRTHLHQFESLYRYLPELMPAEPPALIHGDLWSGNFLCSINARPYVFDPAVSYAHREMDLAMSKLFGGFHRRFYQAYEEAFPLQPGFGQRLKLFQLYYLLVHLNLFGSSYLASISEILNHYS